MKFYAKVVKDNEVLDLVQNEDQIRFSLDLYNEIYNGGCKVVYLTVKTKSHESHM